MTAEAGRAALGAIDVAVLAGGLGTRLRPAIGDHVPKVLAPVQGRPYLDLLLDWLVRQGVARVVLCLGHLSEPVIRHLGSLDTLLRVVPVVEPRPLGTGGAVTFARPHLASDPVMVMNGDSWVEADLAAFLRFHTGRAAFASLVCVEVDDAGRYGSVEVGADLTVARFAEKDPGSARPGLVNAGIYLLSRAALDHLAAAGAASLERDFLQRLPAGSLHAFVCRGARFVDIGTPASLEQAGTTIELTGDQPP